MAENAPLTESERAELERLRAEKARRDAERERAELEVLRAELADGDSSGTADALADPGAAPRVPSPAASASSSAADGSTARGDRDSFAVRMVSTTSGKDDVPGMAPAQKIIVALCIVMVVVIAAYIATGGF